MLGSCLEYYGCLKFRIALDAIAINDIFGRFCFGSINLYVTACCLCNSDDDMRNIIVLLIGGICTWV